MKRGTLMFILLFMTSNFCLLWSQENSPEELDAILNKCAVYCEKLAHASLYFVCNERIEEDRYEHFFRRLARNPSSRKVESQI